MPGSGSGDCGVFESSQGTTFTFAGASYKCLDIQISDSAPEPKDASDPTEGGNKVDVSTLDLASGSYRCYQTAPLLEPTEATDPDTGEAIVTTTVTITFRGASRPPCGVEDTLSTSGAGGTYKCTESSVTRRVGEFVEGSATFVSVPPVA